LARAQTNLSLERYNAERRRQRLRTRAVPEPQVVEGNELAHYNLGLAFRQKGYYNEALREYRLALERGEDRRLTLQAMAELHLLKRDFAAALELYETLLREVPDSPKLWNERGVVLHQAGRPDEALASYQQAIEIDGKYALSWNNRCARPSGRWSSTPTTSRRSLRSRSTGNMRSRPSGSPPRSRRTWRRRRWARTLRSSSGCSTTSSRSSHRFLRPRRRARSPPTTRSPWRATT